MSVDSTIELSSPIVMPAREPVSVALRRAPWRVALRDLTVLIALAVVAELLLQVVAPQYGHDYYDRGLTASQPVTFNADGYRGTAVPMAKQPGEYRILALGDSTTFGTGVSVEDTWPMQLQRSLAAAEPGHAVTAMNVALQGASLAQMTAAFEQKWAAYHPDAVTVLISSNMIALAWMHRNETAQMPEYILHAMPPISKKEEIARAIGHLCLPHFLSVNMQRALYWLGVTDHRIASPEVPYGALLAHGWRQGDLPTNEAQQAWDAFDVQLRGLRDAAAQHGAKLVVGFSPCRFDLSGLLVDNEKNVPRDRMTIDPAARLRELCAVDKIDCIDVPDALRASRQQLTSARGRFASMYIMFDYNHLNPDGHAAVAAAMADALRTSPN